MVTKQFALSTVDNPFNPFQDFKAWLQFDNEKGYNSSGKMMRVAKITDEMSDYEETLEIERAIDAIIKVDATNTYIKVANEITYPD